MLTTDLQKQASKMHVHVVLDENYPDIDELWQYSTSVHVYHTSCVATLAASPRQGLVSWNCSYTTSLTSQALVCTMTSLLV